MVAASRSKQDAVLMPISDVPEVGEDGYPVKYCTVQGIPMPFSTRPFAEAERPLYWNPIYPGQEMWWRAEEPNAHGFKPVVQKEAWEDGKFSPRNAYEEQMTRQWMTDSLPGCSDPDQWKGTNHPEGPGHQWRCECSWPCGNYRAFNQHRRYLKHQESMSE